MERNQQTEACTSIWKGSWSFFPRDWQCCKIQRHPLHPPRCKLGGPDSLRQYVLLWRVENEDVWFLTERAKRVSMTSTLWVLFGFFCDENLWCQVWRTLLLYFQRYSLFSILLFKLHILWHHHFLNLHNTKTSISLKWNQRPFWGYDYFAWWSTYISISRKDKNILALLQN